MKSNRSFLLAAAVLVCCTIVWFSTSICIGENTYSIEPQIITLPEYKTDAARAIDAYERLMQRYMDMTERNLMGINAGIRDIIGRLDSISSRLDDISQRTARIEKALGLEQEKSAADTASPKSELPLKQAQQ
ncbi:MAG: hypothetical protein KAS69_02755 [Planctomycetes bacterium]|nr:hypothetical protein [Planctomycetota bacterium]